jgi:hypothetical protein
MTIQSFANHRICVYQSNDAQLTDEELPPHFSTPGVLHIGYKNLGIGSLLVTRKRIVFTPTEAEKNAIAFEYRSMVMHAITSDDANKYIFVQLLSDDDEDEEAEEEIVKLIPTDQSVINILYEKITEMSALNPDDMDDVSSDFEAACDDQDECF